MNLFLCIVVVIICIIMWKSLIGFIQGNKTEHDRKMGASSFSSEMFYTLLVIYTIVMLGFGLIYFILSFEGILLVEHGELRQVSILGSLIHSFYFSGVTLLTIGYGDIIPIGIGRFIALIEALIGYVLPTAFMLRLVIQKSE
ncbi:MAG TPA: potassium channel family protein [Virgibacillus sp.]|nr:potassium channel family protein [Virgibacillus sp.]